MNEFEQNCYGMSQEDIRAQYMESLTARISGQEMVVMGILSDCQEMISMKNQTIPTPMVDEAIRKQMNIAKFILSEMMESKERV